MPTLPASDAMPPNPRRRRFQFSLRTLLATMVVLAFASAWLGFEVKRGLEQRRAVHAFQAAGATVGFGEPRSWFGRSKWLRSLVGDEALLEVTVIVGRDSRFSDSEMEQISEFTQLQSLQLYGTQVTDEGMSHLRGLTELRFLLLFNTRVTDATLSHLDGLTQLRNLVISDARVTDAGLSHLSRLTKLQYLWLSGTQVTDEGVSHLRPLTQLVGLDLARTQVTDDSLLHLREMTQLTTLHLSSTRVTADGAAKFQQERPNLHILR